jgi:hypothetical protein
MHTLGIQKDQIANKNTCPCADMYGTSSPRDAGMPHQMTAADLMGGGAAAHGGMGSLHQQYGVDAGLAGIMTVMQQHTPHQSLRMPQSSAEAIQLGNPVPQAKSRGLTKECRSMKQAEQTRKAQTAKK